MEEVIIEFKNGLKIQAEYNGSCFVIDNKPDFPLDLSEVIINDEPYYHVKIIECASVDGRYWFTIQEIPKDILIRNQMQANIEYIAMMSDIDLEV